MQVPLIRALGEVLSVQLKLGTGVVGRVVQHIYLKGIILAVYFKQGYQKLGPSNLQYFEIFNLYLTSNLYRV